MTRLPETYRSLLFSLLVVGCGGAEVASETDDLTEIQPQENWKRDILATDLVVDLQLQSATAVLEVDASTRRGASFEIGDLQIEAVRGDEGELRYRVEDGRLDVGIKARQPHRIEVDYRFQLHGELQGALETGSTFLWPYFCKNLFPCKSDPHDGLRLSLELEGVPEGTTAIYPEAIESDAPSYMLAWATGDYTKIELGTTSAGRNVSVYHLPGDQGAAVAGSKDLVAAFDWIEQTYGAYTFGDEVASVSANWGPGAFGGMEHHPFWHISRDSMGDPETHVHEAAHGWFGDGVRIACWEDLTLSEGTVSYITARAMEAVMGEAAGDAVWADYGWRLDDVIAHDDRVALPAGCGEVDVVADLWSEVVYMKGAFFYRAVEQQVGRVALDAAIARFYQTHANQAARMQDMLDAIEAQTGFDPSELADGWLRSLGRPDVG